VAPILVLAISVLSAVLDGTVASESAQFLLPQWLIDAFMLAGFGLLLLMGLLLSFQTTPRAHRMKHGRCYDPAALEFRATGYDRTGSRLPHNSLTGSSRSSPFIRIWLT
jgi:hypothetical protein